MSDPENTNIKALAVIQLLQALVGSASIYFVASMEIDGDDSPNLRTFAVGYIGVITVLLFMSGIGLLKRKKWGLPYTLVVGWLQLPGFPMGTILGIWSLVVHRQIKNRIERRR